MRSAVDLAKEKYNEMRRFAFAINRKDLLEEANDELTKVIREVCSLD